ncbi:hypothetical protein [Bacillus cereus]
MDNQFSLKTNQNITPSNNKKNKTELELVWNLTGSEPIDTNENVKRFRKKRETIDYNEQNPSSIDLRPKVNTGTYNVEELSREEYLKVESEKFLSMLRNDYIEAGYYSSSELYLKSKLEKDPIIAKSWLNKFFYDNLANSEILVKLLHIISDIDYRIMAPEGPIMAMAASNYDDDEVREYSIRVFEKWANPESLKVLKKIRFSEDWLQEYANEVIIDLEEELF